MQDCGNEFFSHPEGTVLLEAEGASEGGNVECDGDRLDHGHVVVYAQTLVNIRFYQIFHHFFFMEVQAINSNSATRAAESPAWLLIFDSSLRSLSVISPSRINS